MEDHTQPIMDVKEVSFHIKQEAGKLGFDACGIAPAHPLPLDAKAHFLNWLGRGYQGNMHYMERNLEVRLDPTKLVPEAASVIVVALNYATHASSAMPGIANYAKRPDYHPIIRERLYTLLERIRDTGVKVSGRAFSDSAPLAERYWAEQAGIGWIGKNHVLIIPHRGSWFLLGALIVNLPLHYDKPMPNRCGACSRCIEACPNQALHREGCLDATRCLSYLTIEKKGEFTSADALFLQGTNSFFGCDICQEACPWNRFSRESSDESFPVLPFLKELDTEALEHMDAETFKQTFHGTSLERTGVDALVRNLKAIKKVRPSE